MYCGPELNPVLYSIGQSNFEAFAAILVVQDECSDWQDIVIQWFTSEEVSLMCPLWPKKLQQVF